MWFKTCFQISDLLKCSEKVEVEGLNKDPEVNFNFLQKFVGGARVPVPDRISI